MEEFARREIKTRDKKWAQNLAKIIAEKNITPNMISILSVFFALCSGIIYCCFGRNFIPENLAFLIPILAVVFIQLRLLCNLFDGMVAVEYGKRSIYGDIYNEFPDRLSDSFIIIGAGFAGQTEFTIALGLIAALLAMFTAYTRLLGGSIGAKQYFIGPMAKQHRMALLTVGTLVCTICPTFHTTIIPVLLEVMIVGCAITVFRRVKAIAKELKEKANQ